jgi:hypothetical protein
MGGFFRFRLFSTVYLDVTLLPIGKFWGGLCVLFWDFILKISLVVHTISNNFKVRHTSSLTMGAGRFCFVSIYFSSIRFSTAYALGGFAYFCLPRSIESSFFLNRFLFLYSFIYFVSKILGMRGNLKKNAGRILGFQAVGCCLCEDGHTFIIFT